MSRFAGFPVQCIATIDTAHYGLRDFPDGRPGLWFGVSWNKGGSCTFYAFTHDETEQFIIANRILDIEDLNGKQCIVEETGPGCSPVRFVKLLGMG